MRTFAEPLRAKEKTFGNSFRTIQGQQHFKKIAISLKLAWHLRWFFKICIS
jgi:hypothetical protein